MKRVAAILLCGFSVAFACAFDDTLREYLDRHFWLPFSKTGASFEKKNVLRVDAPFAGMGNAAGTNSLARLRAAYQDHSPSADPKALGKALAAAKADASLTGRDREEVNLLDAKVDMWTGEPPELEPPSNVPALRSAQQKFEAFLRTAKTPELLSEARGWLAHIHFVFGEQTEAGKIYLDELNRNGSNLGRETILTSLRMTYGYDGGPRLMAHLEEYFDTPEHAAFAVQLATNPHWDRLDSRYQKDVVDKEEKDRAERYRRVKKLFEMHRGLFAAQNGSSTLTLLGMRTALAMGDPAEALSIAQMAPAIAPVRREPDFLWMLGSAHFVSRDFADAERPLLDLFQSPRSSTEQKAAAAYGLCGVYEKTKNAVEQIRFALWLRHSTSGNAWTLSYPSAIEDQGLYWASSGWDLNLLLEDEASIDELRAFLKQYPDAGDARVVKYALAVRLSREDQYDEAADIYESIHAVVRGPRLRELAKLYKEAKRSDLSTDELLQAKFKLGQFIAENPNRIYFNDMLWFGLQRYAFSASEDGRLSAAERKTLLADERKLKDDQEELWRAYLILRDVARDAEGTELGRRAARTGLTSLRGISERFGRENQIRAADLELTRWTRSK